MTELELNPVPVILTTVPAWPDEGVMPSTVKMVKE
jgi:hypothetical protein